MAEDTRKHLLHVRSSVEDKLPTPDQIEFGEIAINYFDTKEKISFKSSTGNIRTISTDTQNDAKFNQKVDKVGGKQLSTEDFTTELKNKLENVEENANNYVLPNAGEDFGGVKTGGDVTIADGIITVNDNSHQHTIDNITDLQTKLDEKAEQTRVDEMDEVISKAFNKVKDSCGFNETLDYISANEMLSGVTDVTSAIDKLASEISTTNTNVSKPIDYVTYMNTINTVDTLTKVPVDKYLVIATISTTTASLTLNEDLKQNQELHIIVYNSSPESKLTVTLPSVGNYINLSDTSLMILPSSYGEINIISDGNKMFIRAL